MKSLSIVMVMTVMLFGATIAPTIHAEEDAKITTIGTLSAGFLVQTYLNIGFIGDLSVKGSDKDSMKSTLKSVDSLLENTEKQLDKLLATDLSTEDKSFVKKIKTCCSLLNEQSDALKPCIDKLTTENADVFEKARKASWAKIAETLDIK